MVKIDEDQQTFPPSSQPFLVIHLFDDDDDFDDHGDDVDDHNMMMTILTIMSMMIYLIRSKSKF